MQECSSHRIDSASGGSWARPRQQQVRASVAAYRATRRRSPPGKHVNRHVGIGRLQGVHGLAELGIDIPAVGGVDLILELAHLSREGVISQSGSHISSPILLSDRRQSYRRTPCAHVLDDGLRHRAALLLQDAHGVARVSLASPLKFLDTGHDLEAGSTYPCRWGPRRRSWHRGRSSGSRRQGLPCRHGPYSLIHLVDKLRHLPVLSFLPSVSLFLFRFEWK